jgi:hypothetical protein
LEFVVKTYGKNLWQMDEYDLPNAGKRVDAKTEELKAGLSKKLPDYRLW